jgi:hypothetical protein
MATPPHFILSQAANQAVASAPLGAYPAAGLLLSSKPSIFGFQAIKKPFVGSKFTPLVTGNTFGPTGV